MFFVLSQAWDKEKILSPHEESNLMGTQNFFFVPVSWQLKTKNIFLYFFTELKTYHLSYSIYKQVICLKINFLLQYFQLLEARKRTIWYGRELIVEGQISV